MSGTIQVGNGIDATVIVPAAIRAGASRADELLAAEQAKARGEAPPTAVQPQPEGKEAQPPAPPLQPEAPPQAQAQPPAPPEAQPPAPPSPQAPPQVTPELWERRYHTLQGRYNLLEASAQQTQQDLQRQIDELRNSTQRPPVAPPTTAAFDEEDDATWGPDFRNAVQRRIDAAVEQVLQKVNGRVQQVEQVAQAGTEGALRQQLDQLMPEWGDINNDPDFHAWLALPDEMSGVKRHTLVNKAYNERNAQRVLKFFKSFLSEAAPAPAGSQPLPNATLPAPNGVQPPASQRLSLADLAAPGAARPAASSSPQAPAAKRFWTNSEIGRFYNAKQRGLYDNTPENQALAAAYEADIYAAQAEGRVRPG